MNSIKLGDRVRLKPDALPYFPELYFKGVKTVIELNEDQDMAVLSCYEQNPKGVGNHWWHCVSDLELAKPLKVKVVKYLAKSEPGR